MQTTYAQKNENAVQKKRKSSVSIIDSSSQSESLQRKANMANNAAQREEAPRPNNTGMPDNLKAGIESLSGFSMDDVRVHYNSSKPATVQALAYTQGTDIHVAPGQEKHLPHEAWHVAQQMSGRVAPTTNINGMPVHDNAGLEHEADVMGEKAMQRKEKKHPPPQKKSFYNRNVQRIKYQYQTGKKKYDNKDAKTFEELYNNINEKGFQILFNGEYTWITDELKKQLIFYYNEDFFGKIPLLDSYENFDGLIKYLSTETEMIIHNGKFDTDAEKIKKLALKENSLTELSKSAFAEVKNFASKTNAREDTFTTFVQNLNFTNYAKIGLKNLSDLKNQLVQDYLLEKEFGRRYASLVGQKNSYSDFLFDSPLKEEMSFEKAIKLDSRAKKEVWKNERLQKLDYTKSNLVIYRNFDLTKICEDGNNIINLFGGAHGGALGTALYYAEQRGFKQGKKDCAANDVAIVKIVISSVNLISYMINSDGEGADAKTESSTKLPLARSSSKENAPQFSLSFKPAGQLEKDYMNNNGFFEVIFSKVSPNKKYFITDGRKTYKIRNTERKPNIIVGKTINRNNENFVEIMTNNFRNQQKDVEEYCRIHTTITDVEEDDSVNISAFFNQLIQFYIDNNINVDKNCIPKRDFYINCVKLKNGKLLFKKNMKDLEKSYGL